MDKKTIKTVLLTLFAVFTIIGIFAAGWFANTYWINFNKKEETTTEEQNKSSNDNKQPQEESSSDTDKERNDDTISENKENREETTDSRRTPEESTKSIEATIYFCDIYGTGDENKAFRLITKAPNDTEISYKQYTCSKDQTVLKGDFGEIAFYIPPEAYGSKFASAESIGEVAGLDEIYRIKQSADSDTVYYTNDIELSGQCNILGDMVDAPCGVTIVDTNIHFPEYNIDNMPITIACTPKGNDYSVCDSIVQNLELGAY